LQASSLKSGFPWSWPAVPRNAPSLPASSIASWPRWACPSYDVRRSVQATCSQGNVPVTRSPDSSTGPPSASRNSPCTASVDGSLHWAKGSEAFNPVASLTRCGTQSAPLSAVRSPGRGCCVGQYDAQVGTAAGTAPVGARPHAGQPLIWARGAVTALRIAGLSNPWRSASPPSLPCQDV
jgi:hypothetical protein